VAKAPRQPRGTGISAGFITSRSGTENTFEQIPAPAHECRYAQEYNATMAISWLSVSRLPGKTLPLKEARDGRENTKSLIVTIS
jgi:hypothetical protein